MLAVSYKQVTCAVLLNRVIAQTPPWLTAAGTRATPPTTTRLRDSILSAGHIKTSFSVSSVCIEMGLLMCIQYITRIAYYIINIIYNTFNYTNFTIFWVNKS